MSLESDAAWLQAEAEWEQAVLRKAQELETQAQVRALLHLTMMLVDQRRTEAEEAEDELGRVLDAAQRARADLDEAVSLLERNIRDYGASR